MTDLARQLYPSDVLTIRGKVARVTRGGISTCYNIGEDGELWPAGVTSNPPVGHCQVTNLYVDKNTGKLMVEWDNEAVK